MSRETESLHEMVSPGLATSADWREVDREIRALAARRGALDAEEAHWLREARRTKVYRHFACSTLLEYIERTLGYRPRTARERLRVADALVRLPAMNAALAAGRIAYSAVRELSRIATADTEDEWLLHAVGKTLREIDAMVAGCSPGDRPGTPPDPDLPARRLRLELAPEVYARFLTARCRLEEDCGERLSDSEVMAAMCDAVLAPSPDARRGPRHEIALTVCEQCERGWQDAAGQTVEVGPDANALTECDAQRVGRVDGEAPAPVTIDIPEAVRRQVERRDRSRCVVPGCRSSFDLHMHNLQQRAHGAPHVALGLCLLCSAHHGAAHDGRLRITGTPPALRFAHDDGRPYGAPRPAEAVTRSAPAAEITRAPRSAHDDGRRPGASQSPEAVTRRAHAADATRALRGLGVSPARSAAAVAAAAVHVGTDAALDDWIRAALHACPKALKVERPSRVRQLRDRSAAGLRRSARIAIKKGIGRSG